MPYYDIDPRMERDGKSLREWLLLLATPTLHIGDPEMTQAIRCLAAMRIGTRGYALQDGDEEKYADTVPGTPDPDDFDYDAHALCFDKVYREVLADPAFPATAFFDRIVANLLEGQRTWNEYNKKESDRMDAMSLEELGDYEPEFDAQQAAILPGLISAHLHDFIKHAGPALLKAPKAINALLDSSSDYVVDAGLTEIGPTAVGWADHYVTQLEGFVEGDKSNIVHRAPRVLGAIAKNDERTIERLIVLIISRNDRRAFAAAQALGYLAPLDKNHVDVVWPRLNELCKLNEDPQFGGAGWSWTHWLPLARVSIGRDLPEVQQALLRQLGQREDHDIRAHAIDAVAYVPAIHSQAVPLLADAISTFEEFDPDALPRCDPHRVSLALRSVGSLARDAIPAIVACIERALTKIDPEEGFQPPWSLLPVLSDLGSHAAPALEGLRCWKEVDSRQSEDAPEYRSKQLRKTIASIETATTGINEPRTK